MVIPETAHRLFSPEEVAAVLRLYELGEVRSVRELIGGGAGSPKALVECARGRFVLKRRATGRDNPFRVAYAHEIMLRLRARGYPAPTLVGTRGDNNSMVQIEGRVYELFAFVEGRPFARREDQTRAAGRALAELHAILETFTPHHADPPERADEAVLVRRAADAVGDRESGDELLGVLDRARRMELDARAGAPEPEPALVHGDFHPGNLLFREGDVVGVFDFDSARRAPLADDLAQGLVQFSMSRAGTTPDAWPDEPDLALARAFWTGYAEGARRAALPPEAAAPAMARSLAGEWGEGVAAGVLGDRAGAARLLGAVRRKARWLVDHAREVGEALGPANPGPGLKPDAGSGR